MDHNTICKKINREYLYTDINENKVQKFLLILQELVVLKFSDEEFSDSEDGITSLFVGLAKRIRNLLDKNIDFLKFPAVIKKPFETLKALLKLFTTVKKNTERASELKKQENNDGENQSNCEKQLPTITERIN